MRPISPPFAPEHFSSAVLDWYRSHGRDLPWRKNRDPYRIWVSEVMLQQTRVETVLRYYHRFLERFPDIQSLSLAEVDEVLKYWEGLGYYRRATQMHHTARIVCAHHAGKLPEDPGLLRKLPGIGPYMTGALMCIAFDRPGYPLDGNLERVLARVFRTNTRLILPGGRVVFEKLLQTVMPISGISSFVQALMDLGAGICTRVPECAKCPVMEFCAASSTNETADYPIVMQRNAPRVIDRIVVLVEENDGLLLAQRPPCGLLGGLWEFPGVEDIDKTGAEKQFTVQYGIELKLSRRCLAYRHVFTHVVWNVAVYHGEILSMSAETPTRWISREHLRDYTIPAAFRPVLEYLSPTDARRKEA